MTIKLLALMPFILVGGLAHGKLAYDLTQFMGYSAGGKVNQRIPFTVYFVRDMEVNGKIVSVAGMQINDRSEVGEIDHKKVKVLTDKDMEQVNEFIVSVFKLEPKPYEQVGSKLVCGDVPHIVRSISVVGPSNPGSNGVGGCNSLSPKAAQVFDLIDKAIKSDTYKTLADAEKS